MTMTMLVLNDGDNKNKCWFITLYFGLFLYLKVIYNNNYTYNWGAVMRK